MISQNPTRSIPPTSLHNPVLRDAVERHRAGLLSRLASGEDGMALGGANARFLNACFRLIFEGAQHYAGLPKGVALAASGSFGRGAVALRSDADVVLVVDPRVVAPKEAGKILEALLYPLWDATLVVGHQVLSLTDTLDLAKKDLSTATELLDLRFLAGDEEVLRALVADAGEGLFGEEDLGAFIDRMEAETAARHGRFGGSVYLLEPDVKNGAGGMRDLDGVRWAARARYRIDLATRDELGAWGELLRLGVLVPREARDIAGAEECLWRIRNRLHARAARKADRLGFEDQEALAVAMGYGDDRARAAEGLMQSYYLNARCVSRARESLFERLRPPKRRSRPSTPLDLGGGINLFDGSITVGGSVALQEDPVRALR